MNLLAQFNIISGFIRLLLYVALFMPSTAWARQASMTAVGISIDDHDQFIIATSDVEILSRGYFEVRKPLSVDATLLKSSMLRSTPGHFWSALVTGGEDTTELLRSVFSALKTATESTMAPIPPFRVCVMTSPSTLSTSQKELVSSALSEIFGCTDETFVIQEAQAIASALNIESDDVENSSIAVVVPNKFTYILGEDFSTVIVIDTFPPPLNLDLVVAKHSIREIIVVQDSDNPLFGQTYGANKIPIRYEPNDIIARGAALIATLALPEEPVSILPLALGITLHGSLFHSVVPAFSTLPKQVKLTLTTVHDYQRTAIIEVREGSRASAVDNLSITKLHLKDIYPAPAGIIPIEVMLTVQRNKNQIVVEVIETISGRKVGEVVERDESIYEGGLGDLQAAGEKYRVEDAQFRASMGERISRETQPKDAVKLFVTPPKKHEEL
ncbi:unnamed protein product [Rhizoctonia solani]|uniref:Uncharacterized protein n=1 Tax=Rhizoctonia solani TaxID=456999 RepID=A0A8H3D6K0_9AGAM|nr:unnamed protein product [Rhizoctonia solani]